MTEQSESIQTPISPPRTLNRRKFLKLLGGATATAALTGTAIIAAPSAGEIGETAQEVPDRLRQRWLHNANHYPIEKDSIEKGRRIPARPYLTMPLSEAVGNGWWVSEGWELSKREKAIIGDRKHGGIDIAAPYGAKVVVPVDKAYAMSSYWTYPLLDKKTGKPMVHEGKPIGFGYGNFVQLWVPRFNRFIILAHLSEIDPEIPFSIPTATSENGWYPTNHTIPATQIPHSPHYVKVTLGQVIGSVGCSGLSWPYDPAYHGEENAPTFADRLAYPSWDEPHIHMEECGRDKDGNKENLRDPWAIYGTDEYYPSPNRLNQPIGKDPLFLLGSDGLPKFA